MIKNILNIFFTFLIILNIFLSDAKSGTIAQPMTCGESCTVIQVTNFVLIGGPYKQCYTSIVFDECGTPTYGPTSYGSPYGISYKIWKYQVDIYGTLKWSLVADVLNVSVTQSAGQDLYDKYYMSGTLDPTTSWPSGCSISCESKTGEVNYDLQNYDSSSPLANGNACYDDCQQSSEILWTDCIGSSCIASVKYTATGQPCGVETSVDNLQTDPPDRCTDQINEKIQQCGGSLNVLSFDFETCTGECTPDACADQWKNLVDKCGGVMAVSTWDASTCSGTCASDPMPDVKQPDSEAVPENVTHETKTNPDGSSEITKVIVYNVDGNTYAETTTTTYDSSGNQTGSTTSTSTGSAGTGTGSGTGDTQYFSPVQNSGFAEPYNPGEFDIPARFTTFLNNVKSSGLFSFSNDFFNSLPGGGSSTYEIEAGQYGHHTIDLSATLSTGLAVLKTILLVCFGFLSIRAVIMKR